jgi:hypothetical protein
MVLLCPLAALGDALRRSSPSDGRKEAGRYRIDVRRGRGACCAVRIRTIVSCPSAPAPPPPLAQLSPRRRMEPAEVVRDGWT